MLRCLSSSAFFILLTFCFPNFLSFIPNSIHTSFLFATALCVINPQWFVFRLKHILDSEWFNKSIDRFVVQRLSWVAFALISLCGKIYLQRQRVLLPSLNFGFNFCFDFCGFLVHLLEYIDCGLKFVTHRAVDNSETFRNMSFILEGDITEILINMHVFKINIYMPSKIKN